MKPSIGKALDYTGAFVFLIFCIIAACNGRTLFTLAFFAGAVAFASSAMVWTIRRDNERDDLFVEDDGLMRGLCFAFAVTSAVLLVIAMIWEWAA